MKARRLPLGEALLVITLVAVFAALLAPTVQYARQAKSVGGCRHRLMLMGDALNVYSIIFDGYLPPGDDIYGHDIWSNLGMYGRSYAVNLGYLLVTDVVPLPTSDNHIFYCPAMDSRESPTGWFMFGETNPLGFHNWGKPGWFVNIGYDYRDSYDDWVGNRGGLAVAWTDRALVSDIFTRKFGQYCHKFYYNVLFGDGSVRTLLDRDREIEDVAMDMGCTDEPAFTDCFDPLYKPKHRRWPKHRRGWHRSWWPCVPPAPQYPTAPE